MEPLPNCFSIWERASSTARCRSRSSATLLLHSGHLRWLRSPGSSVAIFAYSLPCCFESTIGPEPLRRRSARIFPGGNGGVIFGSLPGFFGTVFPPKPGLRPGPGGGRRHRREAIGEVADFGVSGCGFQLRTGWDAEGSRFFRMGWDGTVEGHGGGKPVDDPAKRAFASCCGVNLAGVSAGADVGMNGDW